MSANFLKISFSEHEDCNGIRNQLEYRNKPFLDSEIFCAPIESFKKLTKGADVKTVYQLDLNRKYISYDFLPGDTIAILPENDQNEVNQLLIRLDFEALSDKIYNLEVLKNTTKKNPVIPKHLPPRSTIRDVFLKHIDIRAPPKKLFLKALIQYTQDALEKEELQKICSPTGSKEYNELLIRHRSLLSLLNAFPLCFPSVELILEYSTPLNPRYYSIASSPLNKNILTIIFFVAELENGLKGVCTGWLQKLLEESPLGDKKVHFYFRKPGDFRFDIENPSILIATGTGIAPFQGFLQHKQSLSSSGQSLPETWLFYGCRYSERDFLCQDEIKTYLKDGTLSKLSTAFSRDTEKKVYVQQKIPECRNELVKLILYKGAKIYVCGDAKTVVKEVRDTIIQLMECTLDDISAKDIINNLVASKRYLVDSWI